jgi:hypothetical protein
MARRASAIGSVEPLVVVPLGTVSFVAKVAVLVAQTFQRRREVAAFLRHNILLERRFAGRTPLNDAHRTHPAQNRSCPLAAMLQARVAMGLDEKTQPARVELSQPSSQLLPTDRGVKTAMCKRTLVKKNRRFSFFFCDFSTDRAVSVPPFT